MQTLLHLTLSENGSSYSSADLFSSVSLKEMGLLFLAVFTFHLFTFTTEIRSNLRGKNGTKKDNILEDDLQKNERKN